MPDPVIDPVAPPGVDVPPCVADLKTLYDAIMAATTGRQVQSVGHRGRQIGYTQADPNKMIALYRQLRDACPRAEEFGLPDIKMLDKPPTKRGRPATFIGGY